ncbi:MAG TPA: hypothetical protein PKU93_02240 [Candidatus Pacearchaeota archaeon]|nr:hypothetical protein [Candidatus Pacearchaeota archaeon]
MIDVDELTLDVKNIDFQPAFINQKSREIKLSMTISNSFKIPNISIFFDSLEQNWPWTPVEIYRENELFPYVEDIISKQLLANKNLINPLENLLEQEIDILPFGMVSKKINKSVLIPIDFIEIDGINIDKESNILFIERIGLGHYLAFYNQCLNKIDGDYVLDSDKCLIKNTKIIAFINDLLRKKNFQKRVSQVLNQKHSKFFYLGIEFKHQKSPLVFS